MTSPKVRFMLKKYRWSEELLRQVRDSYRLHYNERQGNWQIQRIWICNLWFRRCSGEGTKHAEGTRIDGKVGWLQASNCEIRTCSQTNGATIRLFLLPSNDISDARKDLRANQWRGENRRLSRLSDANDHADDLSYAIYAIALYESRISVLSAISIWLWISYGM